jgi:hypothetical protein
MVVVDRRFRFVEGSDDKVAKRTKRLPWRNCVAFTSLTERKFEGGKVTVFWTRLVQFQSKDFTQRRAGSKSISPHFPLLSNLAIIGTDTISYSQTHYYPTNKFLLPNAWRKRLEKDIEGRARAPQVNVDISHFGLNINISNKKSK